MPARERKGGNELKHFVFLRGMWPRFLQRIKKKIHASLLRNSTINTAISIQSASDKKKVFIERQCLVHTSLAGG